MSRHPQLAVENHSDNVSSSIPTELRTNAQWDTQSGSHREVGPDAESSSSESDDEYHLHEAGFVPDYQRSWTDNDPAGMMIPAVLTLPRLVTAGLTKEQETPELTPFQESRPLSCNVTVGSRFSFTPGEDTTLPISRIQESHPHHTQGVLRGVTRGETKLCLNKQSLPFQQSQKLDSRGNRLRYDLDTGTVASGLETPSTAETNHGTPLCTKPSPQSDTSAGSNDTVLNVASGRSRGLRLLSFTSSQPNYGHPE
jgi:hypothetical protein